MLEGLERRDAVVGHAVGAGVRQLVGAQEVAAPQLGRVDARCRAPRGRAAPRAPASRTARARGRRCARRCSCRRPWCAKLAFGTRYGPGKSAPDRGRASSAATASGRRRSRTGSRCRPPRSRRRRRAPCVTSACSCRDLPAASRFSRRSSTHFTGAPQPAAREHDAHLLALHDDLLTEATAGVAHHDADAVLGDAEQPRAEQPHLVRRLRGRVDRHLAGGRRVVDDEPAPLHRHGRRRPAARSSRGRRAQPTRTRRPTPPPGALRARRSGWSRVLVHELRRVLGVAVVDDRGPRVVVDLDELGRVLGQVAGRRRRRARPDRRRSAPRPRRGAGAASPGSSARSTCATARASPGLRSARGEHRPHAGQRARAAAVSMPRMRGPGERAAHEARVQHAREPDVVDEGAVAGEQAGVLDPGHPHAGVPRGTTDIGVLPLRAPSMLGDRPNTYPSAVVATRRLGTETSETRIRVARRHRAADARLGVRSGQLAARRRGGRRATRARPLLLPHHGRPVPRRVPAARPTRPSRTTSARCGHRSPCGRCGR